jgi:hypothetical protein
LFENLSVNSLKARPIEQHQCKPLSFLIGQYF